MRLHYDDFTQYSPFRADFASAQTFVSIDLGDFGQDADALFLRAFDSAALASGVTAMLTLSVSAPGIAYVTFRGVDDGGFGSTV